MSRTKIVATYGPACEDERVFLRMLRVGLDVVRLNISHLDPALIDGVTKRLRAVAAKASMPLAILADMPGPKIRCTVCEPERFTLREGNKIAASARPALSSPKEIAIQYPHLLDDVKVGHRLAINDGLVLLRVDKVDRGAGVLRCTVIRGGQIASRKGVSFLDTKLRVKGLTARDRKGLAAAAQSGVDFIALSFVREGSDVTAARRILQKTARPNIPLIAKIEQHEAIANLREILALADGVMVARGDMGIEQPLESVPLLQKDIIAACNESGKFVITATQMLESMTENLLPTRAEVSDVANAILDGTDAVMLSAETSTGRHPVEAVDTMTRVAIAAETRIDHSDRLRLYRPGVDGLDLEDALAHAACQLAHDASLDALVCISLDGAMARRLARYRPHCPIYALGVNEEECRRLAVTWGVEVFSFAEARAKGAVKYPGSLIAPAVASLLRLKRLRRGWRIAVLAGATAAIPAAANALRVVEV